MSIATRLANPFQRLPRPFTTACLALALAACGSPSIAPTTFPAPPADRPLLLLGEVHDNAAGHAARLRVLDALLARGARPALVMEQLDREDQPTLDALRTRTPTPTASQLLAALRAARPGAAAGGWQWPFYEPIIDRALRHDLPLVAGNVSRQEARRVMREGLAATGFDANVPGDVLAALAAAIEASHCGQVDAALARRMALAQVARDQQMARALKAHAARGTVLIAGNGHVRADHGVPRWLDPPTRALTYVVGTVEPGDEPRGYDTLIAVPAQPRPDPCAAMRPPAATSAPTAPR